MSSGTTAGGSEHPSTGAWGESDAAFDETWQRWRLPMVQLAVMLVDHREAAEDVVQEAFLGLHRRWANIDNPQTYLRTSVVNGCRSVLRRRRTARLARPLFTPPAPDAASDVLRAEEYRDTMRALHRLPRRQREVLVLRYWQELSDEQIARTLGLSESTVRATGSRARAALAKLLTEVESSPVSLPNHDGGQP